MLSFVGSVSAVRFSPDEELLYAGVGPEVRVYRVADGQLVDARQVVTASSRVHGIEFLHQSTGWEVGVYGRKSVATLRYSSTAAGHGGNELHALSAAFPPMHDWVMGLCFAVVDSAFPAYNLLVGTAHNRVDVWQYPRDQGPGNPSEAKHVHTALCETRCLLYSLAFFAAPGEESVLTASGTTFGVVVLWEVQLQLHTAVRTTSTVKEIARLGRHNGVIVRLNFSGSGSCLCSASDDRTIKVWTRAPDSSQYVLHLSFAGPSRVWDCVVLDGMHGGVEESMVYSCGEDGVCRVYNMRSGEPHSSMKGHLGCVWRTALATTKQLVATAGEDSSIKIWPMIDIQKQHEPSACCWTCALGSEAPGETTMATAKDPQSDADCVKCFALDAASKTIFAATAKGRVYCCDIRSPGNPLTCIWHSDQFSFTVAIVVGETQLLLGDVEGRAVLLELMDIHGCTPIVWKAHQHRILTLWWQPQLGDSAVMTASPTGEVKMWRLRGTAIPSLHVTFQCRPGHAIGAITLICSDKAMVVMCGDNKGHLHGFCYPLASLSTGDEHETTSDTVTFACATAQLRLEPVSTVVESCARVKRGGRIVSIVFHRDVAYVLARDGYVVRYKVTAANQHKQHDNIVIQVVGKIKAANSIAAIDNVIFTQASDDKLAAHTECNSDGEVLVSGFRSVDFVLWNITKHYQICKVPCGGSRRPYVVAHQPDTPTNYTLAFAAGHGSSVEFHTSQQSLNSSISPLLTLNANFHGRDVNSVLFVRVCRDCQQSGGSPIVVVTGSEDTLVKIRAHNFAGQDKTASWDVGQHTLHGHPSAIKALCCSQIDGRWPVVFSVGAKQSVMAWQLAIGPDHSAAERFSSQLLCRWSSKLHARMDSANRQAAHASMNGQSQPADIGVQDSTVDHRFHAVVAFPLRVLDPSSGSHVVVVGGTSPTVDVWTLEEDSRSIVAAASLTGHHGLVLCLAHAQMQHGERPWSIVAAGDTSGSVCLWDIAAATADAQVACNLAPTLVLHGVHQSGVNCACMVDNGDGCVLLLTGGDDQSIYVSLIQFGQHPRELWNFRRGHAHSSSLKGLSIGRAGAQLVFSTSADCRIHVWKIILPDNVGRRAGRLDRLDSAVLSVANVAACGVVWDTSGTESRGHDVAVVGRGLQTHHFHW